MKLRHLLSPPVVGILAVLGLLFALDLFTAGTVHKHEAAMDRLAAELGALEAIRALPAAVLNMQSGVRGYLLTGNKAELEQYRAASDRFPGMADKALGLAGTDEARATLAEAAGLTARWVETRLSPLVVKRTAGEGSSATMGEIVRILRSAHGDPDAQRILSRLGAATLLQEQRVADAAAALRDQSGRIGDWMRVRAFALLLCVAALALLLSRALASLTGHKSSREAAERAARESFASLQAMNDASPLGMFMTDADGACSHANGAMERITGLPAPAIMGSGWLAALHPDDRDRVQSSWALAMASAEPFASEHRFLHRGGGVIWVRMTSAAVRDGPQVIGHICSVEDVSERRSVEETLRRSEERLQIALEGSQLALFDWHLPSGEIVLSRQWEAFSGVRAQAPGTTARRFDELLHPEDRESLRQSVIATLKGHSPVLHAEFRVRQASGQWKRLRARGRVTERDPVGRAVQLAGTLSSAG